MTAELDTLRVSLYRATTERARVYAEHIAPLDAQISDLVTQIDAHASAAARAATDLHDAGVLRDLNHAGWNLGRGNTDVTDRLRTFYNSHAPGLGEGYWGQHINEDTDALLIPLMTADTARTMAPAKFAQAITPLLDLIPWRTADGSASRTAHLDTFLHSRGHIEVDLDTGTWTLTEQRWGSRDVLATGTPETVVAEALRLGDDADDD